MNDYITILLKGVEYQIPNKWELIESPYIYQKLISDLVRMSAGSLSPGMVRVNYLCNHFGWNINKIDAEGMSNLVALSEQITFMFRIVYPNNDEALEGLDEHTYQLCKSIPPQRLKGLALARALCKMDYRFAVNLCFCKQFIPYIELEGSLFNGYSIDTSFGFLTSDLTALQFIEAKRLIGCTEDKLPLMAAILYQPKPYSSEYAHVLAHRFERLDKSLLYAISFNFQAFVNYLFSKTEFRLLTMSKSTNSVISTGALESLYNLSNDGLGNVSQIEQLKLIPYLTILRKKTIESVRSLHASKMEITAIADTTGLPTTIIKKIL